MIVAALLAVGLTLGPYTGPPLNGAIPGTEKFGVQLRGVAREQVHIHAVGVPKGWIASFCTNLVCSPFMVHLVLPSSGSQLIELQLIRNDAKAPEPRHVTVASGATRSTIAFARGIR